MLLGVKVEREFPRAFEWWKSEYEGIHTLGNVGPKFQGQKMNFLLICGSAWPSKIARQVLIKQDNKNASTIFSTGLARSSTFARSSRCRVRATLVFVFHARMSTLARPRVLEHDPTLHLFDLFIRSFTRFSPVSWTEIFYGFPIISNTYRTTENTLLDN